MRKILYMAGFSLSLWLLLSSCFLFNAAPEILAVEAPAVVYGPRVIVTVSGSDNTMITGWIITPSAETPDPASPDWQVPVNNTIYYDLPQPGSYTLYVWAKDDKNKLSSSISFTVLYVTAKWTFMIWLNGDNNLEPYAMLDLNEMEHGLYLAQTGDPGLLEKLVIIAQVDRIAGFDTASHDSGSDWTGTRRYLVKPDAGDSTNLTSELVASLGEVNMGDAANLRQFIDFCRENYPAEHTALIIWNHGTGVRSIRTDEEISRGVSVDDTSNYDMLYTGEITDILTKAQAVDLLGVDACLTGTAEIAYEYRPGAEKFGADYFVASPATEQVDGWDYAKILARLAGSGTDAEGDPCYDVDSLTPVQLARVIVKEYADFITGHGFYYDETMTAMDLSKIQQVKTALDNLAAELPAYQVEAEGTRGSGTDDVTLEYFNKEEFGGEDEGDADLVNDMEWIFNPHFDLYDFAERIANNGMDFPVEVTTAAAALMTAVDDCVLASYAGGNYDGMAYGGASPVNGKHGMAFFFPDGDKIFYNQNNSPHYAYQWWYTNEDTSAWSGGDLLYGKIDFCNSDTDGIVETWRELLEFWFDPSNVFTPGDY